MTWITTTDAKELSTEPATEKLPECLTNLLWVDIGFDVNAIVEKDGVECLLIPRVVFMEMQNVLTKLAGICEWKWEDILDLKHQLGELNEKYIK